MEEYTMTATAHIADFYWHRFHRLGGNISIYGNATGSDEAIRFHSLYWTEAERCSN
jgi:hypothetical protein